MLVEMKNGTDTSKKDWVSQNVHPRKSKIYVHTKTCPWKVRKELCTVAEKCDQFKPTLTDEWRHKMWAICIMEYYLAMKRKEELKYATRWINLDNILQCERIQAKKCHILYDSISLNILRYGVVARGWRRDGCGVTAHGYRNHFRADGTFWN